MADTKRPSGSSSRNPKPGRELTPEERRRRIARKKELERRRIRRQRIILSVFAVGLFALIVLFFTESSKRADERRLKQEQEYMAQQALLAQQAEQERAEAEAAAAAEEAAKPKSITISVVGDCTLGTDEYFDYSTSLNSYFETYGSSYFMENVRSVFAADDLTIANFEGVLTNLTTRADKQFAFKASADYADILTEGSIEAVTTANNHSHDYGDQSYTDTLEALEAAGVVDFGYDKTAVMDVNDVQVGLVGIYELNEHLGVETQLKEKIAEVKDNGAELVIVIFHWGNEKETYPDQNQTTLGRMAIDEGADLVCGHHPHVLQGIETYKGKNIVYSLGNFCFGGNSYPSDMDTMIYQQTFTVQSGEVVLDMDTNIIPCSISSAEWYNNYQPTPSVGDEADRILSKIEERSAYITLASADSYNYFTVEKTSGMEETSADTEETTSDEEETITDYEEASE